MGSEIDQYYLIISSNEFDEVYPLNNNTKFRIDLPSVLFLDSRWEVGLTEVWFRSGEYREQLDLCTDFCIESLVNGKFIPLLRRIETKKGYNHIIYSNPVYVNLSRSDLKQVLFYINRVQGKILSFMKGELTLKVHFRKRLNGIF